MSALEPPSYRTESDRPTVESLAHALRGIQEAAEVQTSSMVHILHDDLGGLLVSAMMDLSWINQHLGADPVQEKLARIQHALSAAIDLNRNLIESLRPSILDNFGLIAAFRWHLTHACERAASCTHTLPNHEPNLRPEASIALFRIGQETVSAVLAEPLLRNVDFSLAIGNESLVLQVAHEHYAPETVDMLHAAANLHATIQRIERMDGKWSIRRSETGSLMRAEFPWSTISPNS